MVGVVLASPFIVSHPLGASTFILASVVSDLDALSRLFGKRAFLAAHQTWSHALPLIFLVGAAIWLLTDLPPEFSLALVAGMSVHALLDWTNTYGITLWAPFTNRRFCAEWVFFIDSFVLVLSVATLLVIAWTWPAGPWPAMIYGTLLVLYVLGKGWARRRAMRRCPSGTLALIPSALLPWRWIGCAREEGRIRLFRLNGKLVEQGGVPILDDGDAADVREFRSMRALSNAYHVTERTANRVVCRDLRIRNFGGRFGTLELEVGDGPPRVRKFEV